MSISEESNHMIYIWGSINNISTKFLLDTGATHNFISSKLAARLEVKIKKTSSAKVRLADGSMVSCREFADVLVSFGTTQ